MHKETRKVEYGMILGVGEFDVLSQHPLGGQGDKLGRWEKKWQEGDQSYVQYMEVGPWVV